MWIGGRFKRKIPRCIEISRKLDEGFRIVHDDSDSIVHVVWSNCMSDGRAYYNKVGVDILGIKISNGTESSYLSAAYWHPCNLDMCKVCIYYVVPMERKR